MNVGVAAGGQTKTRPEGRAVLWLGLSALGAVFVVAAWLSKGHGYDLTSYWQIPADPYPAIDSITGQAVFRYAPPVMWLFAPLSLLPWAAVPVVWMGLQLGALYYIGGRWALALVLFPPVWLELVYGNVGLFLAAVVVLGFRWPAVWAFALLTKITPGVGVLWFLGRREWRSLAVALGVTVAIVGLSLVFQGPALWASWFDSLARTSGMPVPFDALPVPLWPRVIAAAALVLWAGYTDRRYLVPIAVTLAMPTLWVIAFAPLIALVRERRFA